MRSNFFKCDIVPWYTCYSPLRRTNKIEEEIWKPISENPDYQVSSFGRVKNKRNKILKTWVINSGYECIRLTNVKETLIHRLVAREFCDGYQPFLTVNHKDANRLNNTSDNLEWVTHKENVQDTFIRGTGSTEVARKSIDLRKAVTQMDLEGNEIKVWNSISEASKVLGLQPSKISAVCGCHRKTTGGFRWKFTDVSKHQSVNKNHRVTRVSPSGDRVEYLSMLKASESIGVNSSTLARQFKRWGSTIDYRGYRWEKE